MAKQKVFFAVASCALLFVGIASSQVTTGSILGTVRDSTGAVVPGTAVVLLNEDTGVSRTVQADSTGRYSATSLSLGNYRITATQPGFQTQVRSGIVLTVGREAVVDLVLSIGAVTQTVEVTGEAPMVDTSSSTVSSLVSQEQIRDLPLNGRSFTDLVLLSPGVYVNFNTQTSAAQGFAPRMSINGSRSDAILYLLDGSVTNDPENNGSSAAGVQLGVEAIREFRVLTHNFSAEYGRSAGGVVSAVTRSGTNQFHGSVYEFVRNNIFDARDFFNPDKLPPFRRNQFGAAAGGPVAKDRVFFFANYEGLRQRRGQTPLHVVFDANAHQGIVPTSSAAGQGTPVGTDGKFVQLPVSPVMKPYLDLWPLPNNQLHPNGTGDFIENFSSANTEDYALERMDFHLGNSDNLFWRYVYDPSTNLTTNAPVGWWSVNGGTNHFVTVSETHIFSPTALNDFRFSFNRTDRANTPIPWFGQTYDLSLSLVPGMFGLGELRPSVPAASLAAFGPGGGVPQQYTLNLFETSESFSLVRGPHSLKFGIDMDRNRYNSLANTDFRGIMTFNGWANTLAGIPQTFQIANPSGQFSRIRGWRRIQLDWYVNDDFRVTSHLTLNLGFRHEFFTNPTEVHGQSASLLNPLTDAQSTVGLPFTTPYKNFSPRAGLAWDPRGNGKTAIRMGAGVYYNEVDGRTWQHLAQPNERFWPEYLINVNPSFPHGIPAVLPAQTQSTSTVQYNLQTPTVIHYGLEVQQQILPTVSLRVGYVGWYEYNQLRYTANRNTRIPTILADGTKFFPSNSQLINPTFSSIAEIVPDAIGNYNALQVEVQKSLSAGLRMQVSYAFSKTLSEADNTTNSQVTNTAPSTMDFTDPGRDYSLSAYDQRHTLTINGQYDLPWNKFLNSGVSKALLGGWAMNGILKLGSGLPADIQAGFVDYNSAAVTGIPTPGRPDLLPGFSSSPTDGVTAGCGPLNPLTGQLSIPAGQKLGTPERWFDPCAFALPPTGTFGNLGRNTLQGPPLRIVNFTLVKNTVIREGKNLEFRAEFFNLLNHPNFLTGPASAAGGAPAIFSNNRSPVATIGRLTTTATLGREVQFGLKFSF